MDYEKFMEQLKKVLVEHGVESFGSCGCCDGTWVTWDAEGSLSLSYLEFKEGKLSATIYDSKNDQTRDTPVSV